jgi:hypothetical protein
VAIGSVSYEHPSVKRPLYSFAEADRIARVTPNTSRRWLKGYSFWYDGEHRTMPPVTWTSETKDAVTFVDLMEVATIDKLRKKGLIKPSKKKFPIYLTEHGYMVADNPAVRRERRIPESRRAKWIVQSWEIAQKAPRIKQNLHFGFISPSLSDPSGFFDMGLIKFDGTLRQSFTALQAWIQDAAADGRVARPGPCGVC